MILIHSIIYTHIFDIIHIYDIIYIYAIYTNLYREKVIIRGDNVPDINTYIMLFNPLHNSINWLLILFFLR